MKVLTTLSIASLSVLVASGASAQVNDSCNSGTGTECVNASQTTTGQGVGLLANCDNGNECIKAFQTGAGGAIWGKTSGSAAAVEGDATANGTGGYFSSDTGYGMYAASTANSVGVAAAYVTASGGTSSTALAAENTAGGTGLYASSSGFAGIFSGTVDVEGPFQSNGTCEYDCPSDERLKRNIAPLKGALDTLLKLKGVTFEWKNPEEQGKNATDTQTGFIAQEVEKEFPHWVGENEKGFKTLAIQPIQMAALQVESIRALKADNDELKARVKTLEEARGRVVSMNTTGVGAGVAGIAIAGALVFGRRKRREERS
jgi:hypothetical protein